jgi:two-component system phosphate regulon sensor histidine kinase PhoR
MKRPPLLFYIFMLFLGLTLVVMAGVTWFTAHSWREFFLARTVRDLESRAHLAAAKMAAVLGQEPERLDPLCKELGRLTGSRLTVILASGKVVGDSDEDPAKMDNHADRPEFQEAMQGRVGVVNRFSYTLGHTRVYVAVPLQEKGEIRGVVRFSLPLVSLEEALRSLYGKIALGGVGIVVVITGLSFFLARRLTRPLEDLQRGARRFAQGELDRRLPLPSTRELAGLAETLNEMAEQLKTRLQDLSRQGRLQQAVLASMTEGVIALDAEQQVIILNQAAAHILGVNREEAEGRPIHEVVPGSEWRWLLNRLLFMAAPVAEEVTLDQGRRVIRAHSSPLQDETGTPMGTLLVMHDVTQFKRLERTRRDFVANVSHELKTPITSIKGFVESLLSGAIHEPDNALNFLKIIARQTDRLQEIINDLLSLARIEQDTERGQIFLTTGRLKAVLQEALQVCEPKAQAKNIRVILNCPEELRARINAPLLEQAVINLVDNAIKYSPENSEVRVEAEAAGAEAVIRVRDQGRGIPREHLPRLFERFYRVDPGRSRSLGGTGLGLAIVKHIAQAHGGKATVSSTPGQGSVFALHLPRE